MKKYCMFGCLRIIFIKSKIVLKIIRLIFFEQYNNISLLLKHKE